MKSVLVALPFVLSVACTKHAGTVMVGGSGGVQGSGAAGGAAGVGGGGLGSGGIIGVGGGSAGTVGGTGTGGTPSDASTPPTDALVDVADGAGPVDMGSPPDLGPNPAFQPFTAGEHPRLFFRKYDLPNLKAKAASTQGATWVAGIKAALGGGEVLRTDMKNFTLWDAFGFGVLYQLTGDQKYADVCRQATQLVLTGTPDKLFTYNFPAPSGWMDTVGPSIAAVAMAYDVCYDGWDATFRSMVAQKLMTYQCPNQKTEGWPTTGNTVTLQQMAVTPPGDPGVWTFGPTVAGAGLTVIATMGDPGVDTTLSETLMAGVRTNIDRVLAEGWGDMGGFYRMAGQGAIMANSGFVPLLQAMRVAFGKDYVADSPGVEWITMHWVFDLIQEPTGKMARYPDRHDAPALMNQFRQFGIYYSGYFTQGLGAISEAMKPAALWTYQTLNLQQENDPLYPHRAALGFVNMPLGVTAKNPAEVIPHIMQDHLFGLYEFRKQWKDQNDILITALLGGSSDEESPSVTVWGFGFRTTLGAIPRSTMRPRMRSETFVSSKDGSGVLSIGGSSLAVDFGGTSGADALLAFVGGRDDLKTDMMRHEDFGARAKNTTLMLGSTAVYVMSLQSGTAPTPTVVGDKIVVGQQTISWNGTALVLGTMSP